MQHVKLFEEFAANPDLNNIKTDDIEKPCVDCDMIVGNIKKELRKIKDIRAQKKQHEQ